MFLHNFFFQTSLIREVKHDVYGKRQTVGRCMSQKHENLRFSACLTLLRSFSIYLGNRQERSLNKSSFSVFWQKENFILPFAVNVMLNLPVDSRLTTHDSRLIWLINTLHSLLMVTGVSTTCTEAIFRVQW